MPPPTSTLKPGKAKLNGIGTTNGDKPKSENGLEEKRLGKPDQAKYNDEQDGYNKEIAIIKAKQDSVRARISLIQPARENDRRSQLKIEMDSLRSEQGKYKSERQKTLDELKKLQEIVGKKIKDAQGTKSKMGFRSVNEVEERISALNAQVESGTMKLVDERKALAELSTLRRSRKALESSGSVEDSIAADRARIDELRKILDDPEVKKITDKYDELKKESDGLREEGDKAYAERNKLFDERNALSAQLDEIYKKKRESAQAFREENDRYYAKIQADQKARQDRLKAERAKEDAIKREAEIVRLREEAKIPAFSSEIDDCQVLINWFKGKYGGNEIPTIQAIKSTTTTVEGVKTLEIRRVEGDFEGMTLKKKGDDDLEGFFGGSGKNKKKGKKISLPNSGIATPSEGGVGGSVNLPMSLLTALLSLGIPPPTGKDDVQRTMNDLETKKAWYEANSATKTKAEVERVEKLVLKLQKKNSLLNEDIEDGEGVEDGALDDAEEEIITEEIGGVKEPSHTVAISGEATGVDQVEQDGLQLPTNGQQDEQIDHVDSALTDIKEAENEE